MRLVELVFHIDAFRTFGPMVLEFVNRLMDTLTGAEAAESRFSFDDRRFVIGLKQRSLSVGMADIGYSEIRQHSLIV